MPGLPGTVPAPDLPPGPRFALVIATTAYTDPQLRRLRAPAQDAADLKQVLADPQIGGFTVTSVINKSAQAIRLAVEDFLADRGADDVLLVYLSCHGLLNAYRKLFFAAKDTRKDRLGATGVEAAWVMDQMEHCRARQQILILDSCFSGAFGNTKGDADVGLNDRFTGQGRGRIVLTASNATEYSYEGEPIEGEVATGSVFTAALVDGLRTGAADADRDGHITVEEAYTYAYDQVRAAGAAQTPQRWAYKSEGMIVLARSAAGRVLARPALPEALRAALDNPLPVIRIAAVSELGTWLNSGDPAREQVALEQLREIADRDNPQVAGAARALLGTGRTAGAAEAATAAPEVATAAPEDAMAAPEVATAAPEDATTKAATGQSEPKASRASTADSQTTARARERGEQATSGKAATSLRAPGSPQPQSSSGPRPGPGPKTGRPQPQSSPGPQPQSSPGPRPGSASKPPLSMPSTSSTPVASQETNRPGRSPQAATSPHIPSQRLTLFGVPDGGINGMAFSPDGKLLATGVGNADATVLLWDPLTGQRQYALRPPPSPGSNAGLSSYRVNGWTAFSPDGRQLATSNHVFFDVRLWDLATGRPQRRLSVPGVGITAGFSPDGHRLAVASSDGTVHWYEPASGRLRRHVRLGVGRTRGGAVEALKRAVTGETSETTYNSMKFSPGLRMLVTAAPDGTVQVWDPETGELQRVFQLRSEAPTTVGDATASPGPTILAFNPDGSLLVVGNETGPLFRSDGAAQEDVELRDVATGQLLHRVPGAVPAGAAFSPDGSVLATGQSGGGVLLWDPATGKQLGTLQAQRDSGSSVRTSCMAFSPTGGMFAVADSVWESGGVNALTGGLTGGDARVRVWV